MECFSCGGNTRAGLVACGKCAALYKEAYGARWYDHPAVKTEVRLHQRQLYILKRLSAVTPEDLALAKQSRTVEDEVVDLLVAGLSTKEVVAQMTAKTGRCQSGMYKLVRKARERVGIWEGARR